MGLSRRYMRIKKSLFPLALCGRRCYIKVWCWKSRNPEQVLYQNNRQPPLSRRKPPRSNKRPNSRLHQPYLLRLPTLRNFRRRYRFIWIKHHRSIQISSISTPSLCKSDRNSIEQRSPCPCPRDTSSLPSRSHL